VSPSSHKSRRFELVLSIGPNILGFLPEDGDKSSVSEMFFNKKDDQG
jgi:hypothetical protein